MDTQIFQYHPVIGYHFIPNLRIRCDHEAGGYLVRTNRVGFRSESEFRPEKDPGIFRVLLFGDSFTAGDGVSNPKRFGDILEASTERLEVYNFGIPGSGTDQQYLAYREIGKDYEADLIVIAVQVENIRRVASKFRLSTAPGGSVVAVPKPFFDFDEDGGLRLENVPVPREQVSLQELGESDQALVDRGGRMPWLRARVRGLGGRAKDLAQKITRYQPLPEYDSPQSREWRLLKSIIGKWNSEANLPVLVVPIPIYHYIEETASSDGFVARFQELREFEGIILHDPMPDYFRLPASERRTLRFENDIHPTPKHHKLLAESVRPVVSSIIKNTLYRGRTE